MKYKKTIANVWQCLVGLSMGYGIYYLLKTSFVTWVLVIAYLSEKGMDITKITDGIFIQTILITAAVCIFTIDIILRLFKKKEKNTKWN